MIEFLITFSITVSFVVLMSIGLLLNKPLKGSCGGINCNCGKR